MCGVSLIPRFVPISPSPPPDEYHKWISGLAAAPATLGRSTLLATPDFIQPNRSDLMRVQMDGYRAIVRDVAARRGAIPLDTRSAFDRVLAHCRPVALAWDRIHPSPTGHVLIAY